MTSKATCEITEERACTTASFSTGRNPETQNIMRADTLTARRLTSTRTAAATATKGSTHPDVAAGGTRAIAIATPTKADPAFRIILIAPAIPNPRARKRERKLGLVLSAIWDISRISRTGSKSIDSLRSMPIRYPLQLRAEALQSAS